MVFAAASRGVSDLDAFAAEVAAWLQARTYAIRFRRAEIVRQMPCARCAADRAADLVDAVEPRIAIGRRVQERMQLEVGALRRGERRVEPHRVAGPFAVVLRHAHLKPEAKRRMGRRTTPGPPVA